MSLFLRKLSSPEGEGPRLARTLGAFDLTLLGIGAIIGAGLFSSIKEMVVGRFHADGSVAMLGAGPAVPVSFLLTALACGFAALCYAEIAAMYPVSGSAYSYSYAAFGEVVAWIIGWDLVLEYAIGNVYVAQSWGDYFQSFFGGLHAGWSLPPWLTRDFQSATAAVNAATAALAQGAGGDAAALARETLASFASAPRVGGWVVAVNVPATAITVALTGLLMLGVRESSRVNALMVALKVMLVFAFIGVGVVTLFKRGEGHWVPFAPNGFRGIWQGAALGFFSYIGFDAVSTAGEECRNPQRDLPRGLIASLVICTVLYIAVGVVLTGVVPWQSLKTNDPLAFAMQAMGFEGVATVFSFGAMVAMTAVLLVFQYGQTRIFMVMARDGLLPQAFARVHPRFQTPWFTTCFSGAVVVVLASVLTPDQAIGLTNIGTLLAFILVAVGVMVLRVREPTHPRPFKVPLYPLTPILAAVSCLGLVLGLERSNWLRLVGWLALGLVVYAAYGYSRSVLRRRS